jgi:hypothetical protein
MGGMCGLDPGAIFLAKQNAALRAAAIPKALLDVKPGRGHASRVQSCPINLTNRIRLR